jgi:hypothetical protein
MNKALIITPTGCPYYLDDEFDKENHWRFRKPNCSYDVCVVSFNDHLPEANTYDMIIKHKGRKWAMLNDICSKIHWENYDFIAYFDDDYCTDIQSVETALSIARQHDMRMFQQSLTSWTVYPILTHNPNYIWTETNFIELGVPFFRNDIFRKVLRFFQDYTPGEAEWGMDKVMCYYLQQSAHVIHASKVKHMRRESYYDKTKAFAEMDYLMKDWFPKYMDEKFGLKYEYSDQQIAFRALRREQ